jgi:quinoprotein glucose dehydrogenase
MDIPCPPILVNLVVNGRPIKALAQPTKQAFMYVFDRTSGQPVWPIEERPVQKGTVPGEWYAPTQPFPLDATGKPFNYDTQGFVDDDLIDFTPALRAEARQIVTKYQMGPIFTPPVVSRIEGPLATLVIGSGGGGTNWPGGSFDPETRILYVSSNKSLSQLGLVPPRDPSKNDMQFVQGNAAQGARTRAGAGGAAEPAAEGGGDAGALTVQGLPIMKPPYGSIAAIDLNKGQVIWRIAHGDTPATIANHPALKGLTIPRTGRPGTVGQLVTKTLLVVGEPGFGPTPSGQRGAMLRAYDKASGTEVGAVYMPAPQGGSPMTYLWNNQQYIVVAVGGAGYAGELLAFRLPASAR